MITLGDYIGQLMNEITQARVMADRTSIQIAQMYANDPLLKTLPVPRVRLPEIKLDVPVLVADHVAEEILQTEKATPEVIAQRTRDFSNDYFEKKLSNRDQNAVYKVALDILAQHLSKQKYSELTQNLSEKVGIVLTGFITDGKTTAAQRKKVKDFQEALLNNLQSFYQENVAITQRTMIIPESKEIKEAASDKNIIRLNLLVVESGLEWVIEPAEKGENERRYLSEE